MDKLSSIILKVRPKTLVTAIAVALASNIAWAADYNCSVNGNHSSQQTCIGGVGDNDTVTVNNVNLTIPDGLANHAIYAGSENVNMMISGNNIINIGSIGDTAILIGTSPVLNGSIRSITINSGSSLDITSTHTGVYSAEGLTVFADTATINHHGTGTINTSGGSAVHVDGLSDAQVIIDGGAVINTYGTMTNGIYAQSTAGNTYVDSNAQITSNASSIAPGIQLISSSGNSTLINRGTITTLGVDSAALMTSTTFGLADFTNYGQLNTAGDKAYGILAYAGSVKIDNQATVDTQGIDAVAIYGASNVGSDIITNSANLTTQNATGIYASSQGALTVTHNAGATISANRQGGATGTAGYGQAIHAGIINSASTGDINIHVYGDVETYTSSVGGTAVVYADSWGSGNVLIDATGVVSNFNTQAGSLGLNAVHHSSTGDVRINYSNLTAPVGISTVSDAGHAIGAASDANGAVTVTAAGNLHTLGSNASGIRANTTLNVTSGDILVDFQDGSIVTEGEAAHGIWTSMSGTNSGNTLIKAAGTIETKNQNANAPSAFGIVAASEAGNTGNIEVQFTGDKIETGLNQGSGGITILQLGTGNAAITNTGNILTHGLHSHGIRAESTSGNIVINNQGAITTQGTDAAGIIVETKNGGSISVNSTGPVNTADAHGITGWTSGGDVNLNVSNNVTTGQATATTHNHGIEAGVSVNGKASVYYDGGTVKTVGTQSGGGNSIGIVAWDKGSDAANVDGQIHLGSNAIVDATQSVGGIVMRVSGTGIIDIDRGALVHGGTGFGISLYGAGTGFNHSVNNYGIIDSQNDYAIKSDSTSGNLSIDNYGTITGYVSAGQGSSVTFNNWSPNSLDLRHFADTDADGLRDTKAVSVSSFGGLNSTFNNEINGVVRLLPVTGESSTVSSGQYLSNGLSSYDITQSGIVQAQIHDLGRFENRGSIDLSANGQAGDTLIISGGNVSGTNGGGVYLSDGGSLTLDTVLNGGDINTQSDLLVLDNAATGSDGTRIFINQVGGNGELTQGNGIKVVEVLGTSDATAFKLGSPVKAGLYEYVLNQGETDQSWYLSNTEPPAADPGNNPNPNPLYNPDIGSYLANQTAATQLFMHSLHDRLGEPQYTERYKQEGRVPAVWLRLVAGDTENKAVDGAFDQDSNNSLVHLGGEIAQWSSDGTNRFHLGVMGSYGMSETDSTTRFTQSKSHAKVDGYGAGTYLTWFENEKMPVGAYVDIWSMYGWYDNEVEGSEKYNSKTWTNSIEAGYASIVTEGERFQWMVEPQVQAAYTYYRADDHTDANQLRVDGNDASGISTRLGVRTYMRNKVDKNNAQPFIEINWLYNDADNSLKFNGKELSDDTPEDKFETKFGIQGEITDGFQIYSHIGLQWGKNSYEHSEVQVGAKYSF